MTLGETLQQIQRAKFWRDKKILGLILLGLFINLAEWMCILKIFSGVKVPVSLHYSIVWGVDAVGPWYKLLVVPLVGLGILAINSVLVFYFYLERKKELIDFLLGALLVSQIILLISILTIANL